MLISAQQYGIFSAVVYLIGAFAVQFLFGLEFLLKNAKGYLLMAYDFDRKFAQSESINFQYLSEEFAHSKQVEVFLLALHLTFLLIFLIFKWTDSWGNPITLFRDVRLWPLTFEVRKMNPYNVFLVIASTNFIGMTFSRGTHQQFYAWYSFSFPFLVDACSETFGVLAQFAIVLMLEVAWSAGKPHSPLQGHLLNFAHFLVLYGLLRKTKVQTYLKK